MEHYKSRHNDFFHFTNPLDDASEFDDDDYDYHELQYHDVDDDRSCDFNFHTLHPLGITQSPPQTSGVMNQNDDVEEFGRFDNGALIGQLDNTMKKFSDKLQHTIVGIGAKISRLEDETCKLDKHVENMKNSEDTYHEMTHRKLRQIQSILQEVQNDVLFLRDKHEIAQMQLQVAKLQGSMRDKIAPMNPQQHVPLPAPQSSCHTPFAACLNQLPSNVVTSSKAVFNRPTAPQAPEITVQKYLVPPNQTPHKNQPEPLFPNFTQSYQPISFQGVGSPQSHPFMSHHSQETPNRPSYSHSSSLQHFPSDPVIWDSTQEHKVSLLQSTHVQPPRNHRCMTKFASYSDIHHHDKLPSLHESSSLNSQERSSISNYTKTPLPHALPTAIDLEDGSSSEENANTIDDIVDKVTAMGFRRDHVKASMTKMTQNGSPVDLNSVLDRMMNNK